MKDLEDSLKEKWAVTSVNLLRPDVAVLPTLRERSQWVEPFRECTGVFGVSRWTSLRSASQNLPQ